MGQDKLFGLQVLRGLAAFLVLVGHVQHEAVSMAASAGAALDWRVYPGSVGVDIFFVISGFVIVYAAQKMIGQSGAFKAFLWRRFVRIAPIYWFYTSLMVGVVLIMPHAVQIARYDFWHVVQSYLFIPHIRPLGDSVRPLLSLGWSLNYEMYFYLILAALLALPLRKMMVALSLYFALTVMIGFFLPQPWVILNYWFDPIVLEFLIGAWLAYAYIRGVRLPSWTLWAGCLFGLGLVTLHLWYDVLYSPFVFEWLRALTGMVFVAALTLPSGAAALKPPRVLTALGDSSYSLYLAHPFIIGAAQLIWMRLFDGGALWLFCGLTICACLIGAHIAYLIIERPLIRIISGLPRRKNTSPDQ